MLNNMAQGANINKKAAGKGAAGGKMQQSEQLFQSVANREQEFLRIDFRNILQR